MALECELKYLNCDLEELRVRLSELGGDSTGPYFESNMVFDYADRSLKDAGILLRLRRRQGKSVLTVKRPPDVKSPSNLKVFEEIQSGVDDFNAVKSALQAVGFSAVLTYEKIREKWSFMGCEICLDRLPFGHYVEIEGCERSVLICAKELDISENEKTNLSYHALNALYRSSHMLKANDSFVFDEKERVRLLSGIGKD